MRIRTATELGQLVRDRRLARSLSQAELAKAIGGVSRQWVVSLEGGKAQPDFEVAVRILEVLGFAVEVKDSATDRARSKDAVDAIFDSFRKRESSDG